MISAEKQRQYHIFISRVTGEFGRVSEVLAADLRSKGIIGKVQIDFRQEENAETTLDKLEQYVRNADAVIALIGQRSGSYPPDEAAAKWAHALPAGVTKATYTQWEVHFARYYKRRLSIYFGFDHDKGIVCYTSESPPDLKADDLSGQAAYAQWLTKIRGVDHDYFSSEHHLCRLVLKETWPVEVMSGPAVTIHPQDLEKLIFYFDENIELFSEQMGATNDPEFAALSFKMKNQINNLSDDYFQSNIVEDSMPQFKVIQAFLINPRNRTWQKRYSNVARQFKNKYQAHRDEFGAFEKIFDDIFDRLQMRGELVGQDTLIYTFLHYMYCNCDLGRRTPEGNP
jgi:hypothetical protein